MQTREQNFKTVYVYPLRMLPPEWCVRCLYCRVGSPPHIIITKCGKNLGGGYGLHSMHILMLEAHWVSMQLISACKFLQVKKTAEWRQFSVHQSSYLSQNLLPYLWGFMSLPSHIPMTIIPTQLGVFLSISRRIHSGVSNKNTHHTFPTSSIVPVIPICSMVWTLVKHLQFTCTYIPVCNWE